MGQGKKSVLRAFCHAASRLPEEPGLAAEGHPSEAASPTSHRDQGRCLLLQGAEGLRGATEEVQPLGCSPTAAASPGCCGDRCHLLQAPRGFGGRSVPSQSLVAPHYAILMCAFEADSSSSWGLLVTLSSGELGSSASLCVGLCLAKPSERAPVSHGSP